MNKPDLVGAVAEGAGLGKKDARAAVDAFVKTVEGQLASGGEVRITGFGTFRTVQRAARQGRNPQTGEPVSIVASAAPVFKAGSALRKAVKQDAGKKAAGRKAPGKKKGGRKK